MIKIIFSKVYNLFGDFKKRGFLGIKGAVFS